jgi:hypothetical protein
VKKEPDDIDWFFGSWRGNALSTLQGSWRMTFRHKLEWLESAQEVSKNLLTTRRTGLRRAFAQWPRQYHWLYPSLAFNQLVC